MTTIAWPTEVFSLSGHWDTIKEFQMLVMTKTLRKFYLSLVPTLFLLYYLLVKCKTRNRKLILEVWNQNITDAQLYLK